MARRGPKPKTTLNTIGLPKSQLNQDWDAAGKGLSSAARSAFKHAVELLRQRGNLNATDVELVIAYAQTVEIRDIAYQQLQQDGCCLESDRGNVSGHPAEKMHAAACLRLKILAAEMGLTPQSAKTTRAQPAAAGLDYWRAKLTGGSA